ncbi:hypothetical protein BH09BAC3_BH09BAC3_03410 [soil metagenome]
MRFLPVFVLVILASACLSEPDCVSAGTNLVQLRLRDSTNAVTKAVFSSIKISGLSGTYSTKDTLSTFKVPVNPAADQTSYDIEYTYFYLDSIPKKRKSSFTISYTAQNIIVSTTCPPYKLISNLDVPEFSFREKPLVVNRTLSPSEALNIEIKL